MKRNNSKIFILSLFLLTSHFFYSCLDQEPVQTIDNFTITLSLPDEFENTSYFANQIVTLKGQRKNYSALTDSTGKVVFENIIPDIYDIFTSKSITNEISLIADTLQYDLFSIKSLHLKLNKSLKAGIIISKIYASGTKDLNNKNYVKDKYIELFNNSDEVLYIDSTFYFGLVEADANVLFPAKLNPGYVYARQVFRFPVKDKPFAIQPGANVLITSSAVDHTQFSLNSADLQLADFEAKNTSYSNNPNVPALDLIYSATTATFINLVSGGDNGIFLFKTIENVKTFPLANNEARQDYMRIPIEYVFDGVESLKNYSSGGPRPSTKRLQSFVDAGYAFITATTGYTNESIERRIDKSKKRNDRYYLLDTNNSFNDFRVVTDPTPRKYDKPLLME